MISHIIHGRWEREGERERERERERESQMVTEPQNWQKDDGALRRPEKCDEVIPERDKNKMGWNFHGKMVFERIIPSDFLHVWKMVLIQKLYQSIIQLIMGFCKSILILL